MPGFNDLASLSPELAKEWHPTKNSISPDMVTVRSGISVWWKCKICFIVYLELLAIILRRY
jgi:hypothetical protein